MKFLISLSLSLLLLTRSISARKIILYFYSTTHRIIFCSARIKIASLLFLFTTITFSKLIITTAQSVYLTTITFSQLDIITAQ